MPDQTNDRFTAEAIALWEIEGRRTATEAEVDAFLSDVNQLAKEHHVRDWRSEPMITRATTRLPSALVGFRLFDGETNQAVAAEFRTDPTHSSPDGHSVISALSMRNVLAYTMAKLDAPSEEILSRFEKRQSESDCILDLAVFGGVAHL